MLVPLLSTSPHGDAVGFRYGGGCLFPGEDLHLAVDVRCWAHERDPMCRQTSGDAERRVPLTTSTTPRP